MRRELQERDDAVASAVHELRTPLTSVQAYGQLMTRNLQAVQRQVAQLDRLIGDLLRMESGPVVLGQTEDVDLLREAREAAARMRLVGSAEIELDVRSRETYVVRGDAGRLAQVLDNLLHNAAKFSPTDQPITIALRREHEDVVVSVTDRGAGIPADELPRVFERYYRGDEQRRTVPGAGIGLAVSREIVTAHGGRIWAMSEGPGKGTTVSFALPAALRPSDAAALESGRTFGTATRG
jgi:two-component system sensor histidine kinase VicK